ncbi:helix-turn-helix domain-containing protein [Sphingomonas adhaesiva]|uniref:helix-turn-helix domain-containing protein n=1 Tax=Sphingomonas adhaesiva TaxID=28212 RepID=UPI002FF66BDF
MRGWGVVHRFGGAHANYDSVIMQRLTPRQQECLRLTYERKTSKEIASTLGLSVGTVNTYISEAISVLGARNRRHAAELLHASEPPQATPDKVELHSEGVPATPAATAVEPQGSGDWRRLLPIRAKGATGNDLSVTLRILWIFVLPVLAAIAFGMLAVGTRVLSDFLNLLR